MSTSCGSLCSATYHIATAKHQSLRYVSGRAGRAISLTASFTTRLGPEQDTRALPRKLHRAKQVRAFKHRTLPLIKSHVRKRGCCLAAGTCKAEVVSELSDSTAQKRLRSALQQ